MANIKDRESLRESDRRAIPSWRRPKAPGWKRISLPRTATEAERRQAALNYYYETGDPGPASDMGIYYPDQRAHKAIMKSRQLVRQLAK